MLDLERPCRAQSARLPLETKLTLSSVLMSGVLFPVPQHGVSVHADIQPDLHDVTNRALVRLPAIPRSYAARVPAQLLGCNKRITGQYFIQKTNDRKAR